MHQLEICKNCMNRKMNLEKGLLCGLTMAKPTFANQCESFLVDQKMKEFNDSLKDEREEYLTRQKEIDKKFADIEEKLGNKIDKMLDFEPLGKYADYEPFEKISNKLENFSDALDAKSNININELTEEQKFELTSESNFVIAIIIAIMSSILVVGIILIVEYLTGYLIGLLFFPLGSIVGLLVRQIGKGVEKKYGYVSASSFFIINSIPIIFAMLIDFNLNFLLTIGWLIGGAFFCYKLSFKVVNKTKLEEINKKYHSFNKLDPDNTTNN